MNTRKKCCNCRKLTYNWQRVNGSPWHCYDGCFSTTGIDRRTTDALPAWLQARSLRGRFGLKAWHPKRLWPQYQHLTR